LKNDICNKHSSYGIVKLVQHVQVETVLDLLACVPAE